MTAQAQKQAKAPEKAETRRVAFSALLPAIETLLAQGSTVELPVHGQSMWPLLKNNDRVRLSQKPPVLSRQDLPLYRRDNGQYVLHRVVAVAPDGTYTLRGDHQLWDEPGIRHEQVIGVVTARVRNGQVRPMNTRSQKLRVRLRSLSLPWRRQLHRVVRK